MNADQAVLDRSELLSALADQGLVHGFTTRLGGVSPDTFATLNVSAKRGDSEANVEANVQRIAQAGAFERDLLCRVRQVHGKLALHCDALHDEAEADAIWMGADAAPRVVSVTTADCVPVLIVDPVRRKAAAIHAGWRGVVAQIVPATLEAMGVSAGEAGDCVAAIGPCIEVGAFEVGEEVAEQFDAAFVSRDHGPKPHVDLVACVRAQLERAGLAAANIERVGGCTHANPERYFSYRRDGISTGQALSFVGWLR